MVEITGIDIWYEFSDYYDNLSDYYDNLSDYYDNNLNTVKIDVIIPRIILDERLAVIECWLDGDSREDISKKHNGSGTVFNIIREWANGIGVQQADILRDIAIKLKKTD